MSFPPPRSRAKLTFLLTPATGGKWSHRARILLAFLLLCGGCAFLLALRAPTAHGAQAGTDKAKAELSELRGKIEALQKSLQASESSRGEAADALRESERAISDANRELANLDAAVRDANARAENIRAEARQAQEVLHVRQQAFARFLHAQYLRGAMGGSGLARVLLSGEDPNALARNLHYASYVSRAGGDAVRGVRDSLASLQTLGEAAAARARELADLGAGQLNQRKRLQAERDKHAAVMTRIAADIERSRNEISVMQRNESRLANLLEQLARVVPRAPSRPIRDPAEAAPAAPRTRGERLPAPAPAGTPFSALRGRLALPVRGELLSRFGSPRSEGGPPWRGLFLAAPGGAEVRAVAGGRVVYADWLRGFGNLLIIDHGEDYLSLYGYNESLLKQAGEAVGAAEVVATVGASGGAAQSGLYFELRHQGKPFDPMTWAGR
jgi:septal ring factor EnvC (AmiA/AmiB activator)